MKQTTKLFLLFFISSLFKVGLFAQDCPEDIKGIIWQGNESSISFKDLAAYGAPMLWFSPNENDLTDRTNPRLLPDHFPFDNNVNPIVYYKIRHLYTEDKSEAVKNSKQTNLDSLEISLDHVKAIDLDYYYYFENEYGLGEHKHDIESITMQVRVETAPETCTDFAPYTIYVKRVIGRAHGLHWYHNVLEIDNQTHFPLSILIEEGKHASCPDKDANGVFVPGFDITEHIHDAWGVRDIISSGRLISSGFNSWMVKKREEKHIVFPPLPKDSPNNNTEYKKRFGFLLNNKYDLYPYPKYPESMDNYPEDMEDKEGLDDKMKNKKPHQWPEKKRVRLDGSVKQWMKQEKPFQPFSIAYRWDESHGISIAFPLLLFKNVEAPITGGWLFNKVSAGIWNSDLTENALDLHKLIEHQIMYSTSASRWAEPYIGLGYGFFDEYADRTREHYEFHMVSEVGLKFRFRIANLFMGLRLGWKNVGLDSFRDGGMVIEFGSGVF